MDYAIAKHSDDLVKILKEADVTKHYPVIIKYAALNLIKLIFSIVVTRQKRTVYHWYRAFYQFFIYLFQRINAV